MKHPGPRRRSALAAAAVLAAFALVPGCGGDDSSSESNVSFPANIDAKVCAHLEFNGGDWMKFMQGCDTCCSDAGYSSSTDMYEDRCTCGNAPEPKTDSAVCAGAPDCSACCTKASYYSSIGDCTCSGYLDREVCASAAHSSAGACATCCLKHGSLGMAHVQGEYCECPF